MTAAMEKEREAFEQALKAKFPDPDYEFDLIEGTDDYRDDGMASCFTGWQLARSLASPQVPVEAIGCAVFHMERVCDELEKLKHLDSDVFSRQIAALHKHIESLKVLLPEEKA